MRRDVVAISLPAWLHHFKDAFTASTLMQEWGRFEIIHKAKATRGRSSNSVLEKRAVFQSGKQAICSEHGVNRMRKHLCQRPGGDLCCLDTHRCQSNSKPTGALRSAIGDKGSRRPREPSPPAPVVLLPASAASAPHSALGDTGTRRALTLKPSHPAPVGPLTLKPSRALTLKPKPSVSALGDRDKRRRLQPPAPELPQSVGHQSGSPRGTVSVGDKGPHGSPHGPHGIPAGTCGTSGTQSFPIQCPRGSHRGPAGASQSALGDSATPAGASQSAFGDGGTRRAREPPLPIAPPGARTPALTIGTPPTRLAREEATGYTFIVRSKASPPAPIKTEDVLTPKSATVIEGTTRCCKSAVAAADASTGAPKAWSKSAVSPAIQEETRERLQKALEKLKAHRYKAPPPPGGGGASNGPPQRKHPSPASR